jgi:hypothetical protein
MSNRSGKFYRNNEKEVMLRLGLKPTKNSGSGWIEKEDGENDKVICQLKSTDAQSIKINKKDIDTLEYHAMVSHKLPVFAIQFIQGGQVYILMKPENIEDISKYIDTGEINNPNNFFGIASSPILEDECISKKKIASNEKIREQFNNENSKKFKKERKSAT